MAADEVFEVITVHSFVSTVHALCSLTAVHPFTIELPWSTYRYYKNKVLTGVCNEEEQKT